MSDEPRKPTFDEAVAAYRAARARVNNAAEATRIAQRARDAAEASVSKAWDEVGAAAADADALLNEILPALSREVGGPTFAPVPPTLPSKSCARAAPVKS